MDCPNCGQEMTELGPWAGGPVQLFRCPGCRAESAGHGGWCQEDEQEGPCTVEEPCHNCRYWMSRARGEPFCPVCGLPTLPRKLTPEEYEHALGRIEDTVRIQMRQVLEELVPGCERALPVLGWELDLALADRLSQVLTDAGCTLPFGVRS